jgi:hypothetical protein
VVANVASASHARGIMRVCPQPHHSPRVRVCVSRGGIGSTVTSRACGKDRSLDEGRLRWLIGLVGCGGIFRAAFFV